MSKVIFFDTTSRDGKQAPGNQHGPDDTVRLAKQLVALGVDIMEAGFPISSDADFEAVRRVAEEVPGITCAALARARDSDIKRAADALRHAQTPPRIHVFIASSDIHREEKLRMSPDEVIEHAVRAIRMARSYVEDVEFSPEDASRTGFDFLARIVAAAVNAGARTINITDTVGYAVGGEFGHLIARLIAEVPEIKAHGVVISVHCHNDLGLATANALAGLEYGARQVHCTINGIGERAGNTHVAEVVMALKTRHDYYGLDVAIDTTQLGPTARLLATIIKKPIPDELPVVGPSVFAHSSGIHQDGVAKQRKTYEIMTPTSVGWKGELFPLSSQSGRHGLQVRLADIGYAVEGDALGVVYERFVALAATKPLIYNADLYMLMQEIAGEAYATSQGWIRLVRVDYHKVADEHTVNVHLATNGMVFEASGAGIGPVHSAWKAIKNALTRQDLWPGNIELQAFDIGKSVGGVDAYGLAHVKLSQGDRIAYGRGANPDIVVAYVQAELAAINHLVHAPLTEAHAS